MQETNARPTEKRRLWCFDCVTSASSRPVSEGASVALSDAGMGEPRLWKLWFFGKTPVARRCFFSVSYITYIF